jgi:hypothetical protein
VKRDAGDRMMSANSSNQGLLSSWKEIADYLGCDKRTCRRWELNFELPIHRMEGTSKSRVYAYKDELDAWRNLKLNGVDAAAESPSFAAGEGRQEGALWAKNGHLSTKARKTILWLVPLAAVIVAAAVYLLARFSPGQPVDFKIKGSMLTILDGEGKKLWDFETGLQNLWPEKEYRTYFQIKHPGPTSVLVFPLVVIRDIDRDGRVEVLFAPKRDRELYETGLFCLDSRGKELWHYQPGRELRFGEHSYSADYRILGMEPFDINDDGRLELFLITAHQPHSPSSLVVLNCFGKVLGEFTNFGRIHDIAYADTDADGQKDVLIAGQNDEYGKGFVALFNSARISGASPQTDKYACRDCETGSAEYYLLFPRTDVDKILKFDKEEIDEIHFIRENRLELLTRTSRIYFELDFGFRVQDVKGSDIFRRNHRELKAAGKVTSVLDDAYYEALKRGVLYWDGTAWTSTPTMNRNR